MSVTRRDACKFLGVGLLATTGLLATGCQEKLSPAEARERHRKQTMDNAITPSKAFRGERTLWYKIRDLEGKDSPISALYIFENNQVAIYEKYYHDQAKVIKLGDLNELSDDEIIELFLQKAKESHKLGIENNIAWSDKKIESLQKDLAEPGNQSAVLESIKKLEDYNNYVKNLPEYQPNQFCDFRLHISTDKTGNSTKSERLVSDDQDRNASSYMEYNQYSNASTSEISKIKQVDITFVGTSVPTVVYGSCYKGYAENNDSVLVMRFGDKDTTMLKLDEPNTEGVETD